MLTNSNEMCESFTKPVTPPKCWFETKFDLTVSFYHQGLWGFLSLEELSLGYLETFAEARGQAVESRPVTVAI